MTSAGLQDAGNEALQISDRPETHIKDWMDGKVSAEISRDLFPPGSS